MGIILCIASACGMPWLWLIRRYMGPVKWHLSGMGSRDLHRCLARYVGAMFGPLHRNIGSDWHGQLGSSTWALFWYDIFTLSPSTCSPSCQAATHSLSSFACAVLPRHRSLLCWLALSLSTQRVVHHNMHDKHSWHAVYIFCYRFIYNFGYR